MISDYIGDSRLVISDYIGRLRLVIGDYIGDSRLVISDYIGRLRLVIGDYIGRFAVGDWRFMAVADSRTIGPQPANRQIESARSEIATHQPPSAESLIVNHQ